MDDLFEGIKDVIESEKLAGISEVYCQADRGKKTTLKEVDKEIAACQKCPLAQTRTNVVPGEGDPRADLMFIGEAPGGDEDRQGRPFVGRAGQLLTKII
ncbi:MAG: uracil-DNA glycosylase, partial [Candidatus Omnitrophota bacterium]